MEQVEYHCGHTRLDDSKQRSLASKTNGSSVHVGRHPDNRQDRMQRNINRIIGMACFSVKERVKFQQRIWFAPKSTMLWHAKHLVGYALTEHQIMEHYDPTDEAYTRGHAENTRFSIRYHTDQTESKETKEYFKAMSVQNYKPLDPFAERTQGRNMVIGAEIGSDIAIGPGSVKAVFVDKVTGYKWSMTMRTKDTLPEAFAEYCRMMTSYGHHLKHLKSDDEAVYKTPAMKLILKEFKMTSSQSAPNMKQWNGLAESNIKKSKSMVTSMLSIAKHLSESFWTKAWELSDLIHSLGQCKIVGKGNITKF